MNQLIVLARWLRPKANMITANTLNWLAVVLLHLATMPSLISVMWAWTDKMPMLDIVLLTWSGLVVLFLQAWVQKNMVLMATNTAGFMIQSLIMAIIFFR